MTIDSATFNRRIHDAGLHRPRVGTSSVALLSTLLHTPLAMEPNKARKANNPSGVALAPLISAGLAKLDREASHFKVTDEGRDWLAKVIASGVLKPTNS
jgi:hypothetical protein